MSQLDKLKTLFERSVVVLPILMLFAQPALAQELNGKVCQEQASICQKSRESVQKVCEVALEDSGICVGEPDLGDTEDAICVEKPGDALEMCFDD